MKDRAYIERYIANNTVKYFYFSDTERRPASSYEIEIAVIGRRRRISAGLIKPDRFDIELTPGEKRAMRQRD